MIAEKLQQFQHSTHWYTFTIFITRAVILIGVLLLVIVPLIAVVDWAIS